tara:strand:+ start:3877 stop:4239 length:363 start_codon:yes stop_codon:yes gene_type:complete
MTPDEFTLGHGNSTTGLDGKMNTGWGDDSFDSTYVGETESTYMALTWDLPTWDSPETREDRRRLREESLVLSETAEKAPAEATDGPVFSPPEWLPKAFGAMIGLLLIYVWFKLKRSNGWH